MDNNNKSLYITIPASSANLGPGYDCVGIGLSLKNEFHFNFNVDKFLVTASGIVENSIFDPEKNLVIKAYAHTCKRYGKVARPFQLNSNNNIPFEGGLGSSATAILAGVAVARYSIGKNLDKIDVLKDALFIENHPDNLSASLFGGYIVAYINDKNEPVIFQTDLDSDLICWIIQPLTRTNTIESRKKVQDIIPIQQVISNMARNTVTALALNQKKYEYLYDSLLDNIHEPGRMPNELELPKLKEKLKSKDFYGWAISGSGPSILSLCGKVSIEMKETVKIHFDQLGKVYQDFQLSPDNEGMTIQIVNN